MNLRVYAFNHDKLFPLISTPPGKGVLWTDGEKAFETYFKHHIDQTIHEIARRGGFGVEEFVYFFRGLYPGVGQGWPVVPCVECNGSGEVVQSDEGGIIFKCGVCIGAGAVLPQKEIGS
jgi:hypothetical protein